MKQWGHGDGSIKKEKDDFEDKIVNNYSCNHEWPICLYDFLYKDKIDTHFAFRSSKIEIQEDYFGNGKGDHVKARSNSDLSLHIPDTKFEELLIERNEHYWKYDNLEEKFKALFNHNINEFFLSVIHLSWDDPFDELIDNNDKMQGFIEICSELVDRHNLSDESN